MTVQQPASVTLTINDLINKVKSYLQNNSNVSESQSNPEMRPSTWLRDALREITQKYTFEELRKPGPLTTIGPQLGWQGSNFAYPIKQFLYPGEDYTKSEDPVIFLTPSQFQQVNQMATQYSVPSPVALMTTDNLVAYGMNYLSMKAIQPLLFIQGGIPFLYTRYGNLFYFGSQPGANYNVYLPYQRKHPFSDDLAQSPVYVPEEWFEVVSVAAAEKGAYKNRWNDQAAALHEMLWGDPDYQRSGGEEGMPGMVAALTEQPIRDKRQSPVHIYPGAERY
jgi:hypothetical protein